MGSAVSASAADTGPQHLPRYAYALYVRRAVKTRSFCCRCIYLVICTSVWYFAGPTNDHLC